MHIGIDGNEANSLSRVGVGRYAFEVIQQLYKLRDKSSTSLLYTIYLKKPPIKELPKENSWWKYKVVGPKLLWTYIGLPLHLFLTSQKPQVFFSPAHYAPRFCPIPTVISIMDLSFIHFPELFIKKDKEQLTRWTKRSISKARKVLTISEFSRNEILKEYRLNPNSVIVTYPGFNREKFTIKKDKEEAGMLKAKFHLEEPYFLFVGTIQPRKNIVRLIESYELISKGDGGKRLPLVLVGKKGWLYEEIFQRIEKSPARESIVYISYVDDDYLPLLYRNATCLILPSLYEGFGLPVVEAMACGTPVVVSMTGSLPEIVGDAGVMINPQRVDSIAEGIKKVVAWKISEREAMIHRGLAQIKKFDWEQCAQKTLKILIDVAKGGHV